MDRGFSLVEVLVATSLTTITAIALAQVSIASVRVNHLARSTTVATIVAMQKMEQLRASTLSASPSDALALNAPGYADFVDGTGRSLDELSPPAGRAFVRRWSIDRLMGDALSGDTFLLQVSVLPITASGATPLNAPRRAGEVRLVAIRTPGG